MSILRNDLFGIPIVVVDGELDREHYQPLLEALDRIVGEGKRGIGLDLTGVTSVDALGTELLKAMTEFLQQHGGFLRIVGASASAKKALNTARLVAA